MPIATVDCMGLAHCRSKIQPRRSVKCTAWRRCQGFVALLSGRRAAALVLKTQSSLQFGRLSRPTIWSLLFTPTCVIVRSLCVHQWHEGHSSPPPITPPPTPPPHDVVRSGERPVRWLWTLALPCAWVSVRDDSGRCSSHPRRDPRPTPLPQAARRALWWMPPLPRGATQQLR